MLTSSGRSGYFPNRIIVVLALLRSNRPPGVNILVLQCTFYAQFIRLEKCSANLDSINVVLEVLERKQNFEQNFIPNYRFFTSARGSPFL